MDILTRQTITLTTLVTSIVQAVLITPSPLKAFIVQAVIIALATSIIQVILTAPPPLEAFTIQVVITALVALATSTVQAVLTALVALKQLSPDKLEVLMQAYLIEKTT
jgi:hypothetical protein